LGKKKCIPSAKKVVFEFGKKSWMFVMIQIKNSKSKGKLAFLGIQLDKGQHHLGFLPK